MPELEIVGVEAMKDLGYENATPEDARLIYDAMSESDTTRIPLLDNTISYAARDNEGKWHELRGSKWTRYNGPGRVPKGDAQ